MEHKLNKNSTRHWPIWIFSGFWFIVILLDYINKHPGYMTSLKNLQYPKLYGFLLLLFGGVAYVYSKHASHKWVPPVNGLTLSLFTGLLSLVSISAHMNYSYSETSFQDVMSFFGKAWLLIVVVFLLVMVMLAFGRWVHQRLLKSFINENPVLDIAVGLIVFNLLLFLIAALGFFQKNFIIFILFLMAASNILFLVKVIRSFLFKPIDISAYNTLGIVSFCVLLYILVFHFLGNYAPYPAGFDSRNFYMNISQLVAQNESLVEGFQPYYWSLFMAVGYNFLGRPELALELSFLGMILVVLAAGRLAIKRLNIEVNMVMFCLTIFSITPAIVNQMYTELKVDLAMLFYQILILEYTIILVKRVNKKKIRDWKPDRKLMGLVILIGLLSSFALGIKMINMFMVFTILVLFWWDHNNKMGLVGILSFTLLLFLFAGIDELSGLNKYHLSINGVILAATLMTIIGMAWSGYKNKLRFLRKFVVSAVFGLSSVVLIIPWIVKNYNDTQSLNPKTLLMGKAPGPQLNAKKMINTYNKKNKK